MSEINLRYNLQSGDVLSLYYDSNDVFFEELLSRSSSIQEIIEQIKNNYVGQRYRIFSLNSDETIDEEFPLEDVLVGGSFSENYQTGLRKTLSFTLVNEDGKYTPNINRLWADAKFRLDMGMEMSNGSVIWIEKGIFVIDKSGTTYSATQKTVPISASDKFSLFEKKTGTITETIEIPVGSEIEELINSILLLTLGNGDVLDSKSIIYDSSFKGMKTQATISKSAGDNYGSVLKEIATQLSAEMFYNSEGRLVVTPIVYTNADSEKPIIYDLVDTRGDYNSLDLQFDLSSVVNKIIVIGNSNNGGTYYGEAVNDNPNSPLSYQKIGYRVGNIINDSNITSEELAKERAEYELRQELIVKSSVNLVISYVPFLEVNNLVTIESEFYGMISERFLISSISQSLDYSGTTSISISNLHNFDFLTQG